MSIAVRIYATSVLTGTMSFLYVMLVPIQVLLRMITLTGVKMRSSDDVNHPKHYNYGAIEVIDVIDDWGLNFNLGSAVKYIGRCEHKEDKIKDLKKAIWYIQHEIDQHEIDLSKKDTK